MHRPDAGNARHRHQQRTRCHLELSRHEQTCVCARAFVCMCVCVCAVRASCINPVGMIYGLGGSFQLFAGQVRPAHVVRTYSFGWPLLCDCKLACQLLGTASYISLYRLSGKKYKFRILNKYTGAVYKFVFSLRVILYLIRERVRSRINDLFSYVDSVQIRVSRVQRNRTWKCFIEYKVLRVIVNIKPMTIRDIREELRNDDKYLTFEISHYLECHIYIALLY